MALNLVDKITLFYIFAVGFLIVVFGVHLPYYNLLILLHGGSILLLILFFYLTSLFKTRFIRDWYLIFIVTFFYEETGYLNQMIFHGFWDKWIVSLENTVFKCDIGKLLFLYLNNKVINEIMYLSYFSYYLIIPILGLLIYLKIDRKAFHQFLFTLMVTYYICYLLYIFVPIAGPFEYEHVHITGFVFEHIIRFFYKYGELPGSAMPSSHVAIALIVLIYSKIFNIKFFLFLTIFILLTISTMYLRYHYFLDVEAGIFTGIFSFLISREILKRSSPLHEKNI